MNLSRIVRRGSLPLLSAALAAPGYADPSFQTSGFENPALGAGHWVGAPTNFPGWSFSQVGDIKSGVSSNGTLWGPTGHNSSQFAFVQQTSTMSQTVSGLTVGQQYKLQFWTAQRNGGSGADGTNTVDMFADGTNVLNHFQSIDKQWQQYESQAFTATSTSVTMKLQGYATSDLTSLFDDFAIVAYTPSTPTGPTILNGSFEAPHFSQGGSWAYNPLGPIGVGWNFTPYGGNLGSGIAVAGSTWGSTASDGSQFAFLQRNGSLTQLMTGLTVGQQYLIAFDQSARPGFPTHQIKVLAGGSQILGPTSAGSSSWVHERSSYFTATSDSMLLEFDGIDTGADATSLIDNVQIVPEPSPALCLLGLSVLAIFRRSRSRTRK